MKKLLITLLSAAILLGASAGTVAAAEKPDLKVAVNEVIGTPYKWGGTTTEGFDCSGFILHVFNQFKIELPRTSKEQSLFGTAVEQVDLKPGDLVFFNTDGKGVSHAGIYLGEDQFAHSSSSKGVMISKLSETYYKQRYMGARRVMADTNILAVVEPAQVQEEVLVK
ncbi:C40 family peptidase [Paenibacillus guangzhouensis]|uniref:C40 family peptidase n=1 Tax=Paenibacillus guangzhouensis TaxID=1473112 RepID=UPI001266A1F1|nr:C40 family peptidase [Paenibacillus guangzhouensis]